MRGDEVEKHRRRRRTRALSCCDVRDIVRILNGDLYETRKGGHVATRVDSRLTALEIELPEPSTPGANYVPYVRTGNLLFITAQLSQWNGERRFVGKLGRDVGIEEGRQAARLCALNVIAHLRAALDGDLDRVARCVRIAGFVNATWR